MGKKQRSMDKNSIINAYYRFYVQTTSDVKSWDETVLKIKEHFPQLSIQFIEEDLEARGVQNPYKTH